MRSALTLAPILLSVVATAAAEEPPICPREPPSETSIARPVVVNATGPVANPHVREHAEKERDWFDYLNVILTLLFSGVVALFTRRLHTTSEKAATVASNALIETQRANEVATRSAEAAIAAVEITKNLERAILVFEDEPEHELNPHHDCIRIEYWVRNIGRTPAIIEGIFSRVLFDDEANPLGGALNHADGSTIVLDRGARRRFFIYGGGRPEMWDRAFNAEVDLNAVVKIAYSDALNKKHEVLARYFYSPLSKSFAIDTSPKQPEVPF